MADCTSMYFLFSRCLSMGIYYSLISAFSSPTSTHHRNVQSITRLKSLKKRRRRQKRHHLLNRFFLGANHFSIKSQSHTCLFHEHYTLNSSRDTLAPVHLNLSAPESNQPTVLSPIQCSIAIRRDSLKLIHCEEEFYSIDFIFDADRPVQIYVYFMVHEVNGNNHGSLSYICCAKSDQANTFKQYYAFIRPAGHGQRFSDLKHDIRFPLIALNEEYYGCDRTNRLYPIVIICKAINTDLTRSPSTICGATAEHHTTATTTVFPTFDQFHIVSATVKCLRLSNPTTNVPPDRVSIVLLNQKHIYNGIVFKLYEFYGLENQPLKLGGNHRHDRRKISSRQKSLLKVVTTPTISENEPFLTSNSVNRINEISSNSPQGHLKSKRKKSLSCTDLIFSQNNENTCVICLTDIRNVLLLPCRHLCLCGSCAENLKFQSANCPICRIPFRALLQINALCHRPMIDADMDENEDDLIYQSISLIDALNLATTFRERICSKPVTTNDFYINRKPITTADFKYFCCSEDTV